MVKRASTFPAASCRSGFGVEVRDREVVVRHSDRIDQPAKRHFPRPTAMNGDALSFELSYRLCFRTYRDQQ